MPPLALYSSASIWAAHFTPSPVIAEGPVMAEEKPTRIGGALCAPAAGALRAEPEASPTAIAIADRPVVRSVSSRSPRSASAEDLQFLARLGEPPRRRRRVISTASSTWIPPQPCS